MISKKLSEVNLNPADSEIEVPFEVSGEVEDAIVKTFKGIKLHEKLILYSSLKYEKEIPLRELGSVIGRTFQGVHDIRERTLTKIKNNETDIPKKSRSTRRKF